MWDRHWVLGKSGRPAKEAEEEGRQDRRKSRTGETWSSGREGLQEKGVSELPMCGYAIWLCQMPWGVRVGQVRGNQSLEHLTKSA